MSASGSTGPAPVVVHVIEDDESSRIASSRLLKTAGYVVRVYSTGAEFLACGLGLDRNPTIYTSLDGDVWTLRDSTVKESLRAATTINGTIYIAGDSVIKKSTDGGTTWTDTYTNAGGNKLFMGLGTNGECLISVGFNHNVWAMPVSVAP